MKGACKYIEEIMYSPMFASFPKIATQTKNYPIKSVVRLKLHGVAFGFEGELWKSQQF